MSEQKATPKNQGALREGVAEEEEVYLRILPLAILRVIAVVSLVLSLVLTLWGLLEPLRFENDLARFMLCLAVATNLAVFFFIFYPERIEMNLPLNIGTTLRFAGPVALWLGVFLFLWQFIPSPEYGRMFEIWQHGRRGGMYLGDTNTTYLTVERGKPPDHFLVGANDGSRNLFGIYVVFPRNVRRVEAVLNHEGWADPLPVVLTRDGSAIIDVTSVKEGKPK